MTTAPSTPARPGRDQDPGPRHPDATPRWRILLSWRWILSHLFVVTMVVVMVELGFWQLRRLDQRRAANAAVTAALSADPVDLGAALAAGDLPPDHTRVTVSGTYLADDEVEIANRSLDGTAGSWFATPLALPDDGPVVLVVRGFVPRTLIAGGDLDATSPPSGPVAVTGLAFASVGGGHLAPGTGDADRPVLSRPDLARAAEATGLDLAPVWVRLETQDPPQASGLPVPVPREELSEGPHLSYAIQWFTFSVGTVVVYALILRRRLGEESPDRERRRRTASPRRR
ncbi:MAG: SURF1 family protein [Actinomyces sp.]|nr:MAG: SURF1 family protein [Actinomyces sp.]